MTGSQSLSPSLLERVVLPEPGLPVTMIHFGLLFMYLMCRTPGISGAHPFNLHERGAVARVRCMPFLCGALSLAHDAYAIYFFNIRSEVINARPLIYTFAYFSIVIK